MPCKICNSLRIFDYEGNIICPECLNYEILDKSLKLDQLEEELIRIRKIIKKKINRLNPEKFKFFLIRDREEVAFKILKNIRKYHKLLEDWFKLNLLISLIFSSENSNITFPKNKTYNANLEIFYEQIDMMYKLKHLISLLKFDKIMYIQKVNGEEKIYKTERTSITSLPSSFKSESIDLKFENLLFQEAFSYELEDLIKSELFSQYLNSYYNERILPFLQPNAVRRFYFILKYIIDNFMNIGFPIPLKSKKGLNSIVNIVILKELLKKKFHEKEIKIFFHNMIFRDSSNPCPFNFFYYNNNSKDVIISYNSLQILLISVYSHIVLPKKGQESNLKGKHIEELIHSELHMYDLNLYHPEDNSPLVGVKLFNRNFGDIDVLGYNDEFVVLIESKYWYMPTLPILENEIEKFYKRCKYVEDNLKPFGILKSKDDLSFIRIFYTPFAPFSHYKDILIFPTRVAMHIYLHKYISMREVELHNHDAEIENFLENASERHPYATDMNTINNKIPYNKYRIQDAQIHDFERKEVILSIFNPYGNEYFIFCEINEQTYESFIKSKIKKGGFIKCVFFNILGYWNRIQLLFFKAIEYDHLYIQLLNLYRDPVNIEEIYHVFKTYNLNLDKLIRQCIRKNQLIYSAIGAVLTMHDLNYSILQCECGEIMSYNPYIYEKLLNFYQNGKVKCKYCDPSYYKKISIITGSPLVELNHKLTELDYKELLFSSKKSK